MRHKLCKQCGEKFYPLPGLQRAAVCSIDCGIAFGREARQKANTKAFKAHIKDRKHKLKSKTDFVREAQTAFNAFIRCRDKDLSCVSCGRHHQGQYHAGHYRTTAAQPALRFNELNCHKQCMPCNTHKSGNITEYRIELTRRIGVSLVEWLETDHKQPRSWTTEELQAVKQYYRTALKAMKKDAEHGDCY